MSFHPRAVWFAAVSLLFLLCWVAEAKRPAPKEVAPVIYNGIVYSAPHDKMGYVEAREMR